MRSLPLCMLLLLPHLAQAQVEITDLRVAARVGDQGPAADGILRARLDQKVTLYAVLLGSQKGRRVVVTEAPRLRLGGKTIPASKLMKPEALQGPPIELRWNKIQPLGASYNNTQGGFHWDEIQYQEQEQGPWGANWSWRADARPIPSPGYPDRYDGAGTMAFRVQLRQGAKHFASPGPERRYRGGLSDEVLRVAFRPSDDFLGYLAELFNTPYIWGSAGDPPKEHQAERLIGSDCADFIVYGARRAGKKIPYKASYHIPEAARSIARATGVDAQGRFVDAQKKPLTIGPRSIQVGDVLLFPRHVGALVEDRPPLGVLDGNDRMIHTYWAPPCIQPIAETAYAESPVRVLRYLFD